MRSGAGTTFTVVELLPAGTQLTVTGPGQQANGYTFVPVRLNDGTQGWVANLFIQSIGTATSVSVQSAAVTGDQSPTQTPTAEAPVEEIGTPRLDDSVLRWLPEIETAAGAYGLPPEYLAAVILVESGGDPNVIGTNGSIGLMHVTPQEFSSLGVDPAAGHDPAVNITAGAAVLSSLTSAYGSLEGAIGAYFGDGCTDSGYCGADYMADVLNWAAYYGPLIADPASGGLSVLPADWVAPPITPYVVEGTARPVPLIVEEVVEEPVEPVPTEAAIEEPTATATVDSVLEENPATPDS